MAKPSLYVTGSQSASESSSVVALRSSISCGGLGGGGERAGCGAKGGGAGQAPRKSGRALDKVRAVAELRKRRGT